MLFDLAGLPLAAILAIFAAAAGAVWVAGTRLTGYVNGISKKTGLGRAFAGMLLLGGITSLPEVATVSSAASLGDAPLAVSNLLGAASVNILLLAIADLSYGRAALTAVVARPVTLIQGVLSIFLMLAVAAVATVGDAGVLGVGIGSTAVLAAGIVALRLSADFEQRHVWEAVDEDGRDDGTSLPMDEGEEEPEERPLNRLVLLTVVAAVAILGAGYLLAVSADEVARRTGIDSSMIGFTMLSLATALPEISSVTAAVRIRRFEMAIGDIFGTNIFNMALIFVADLFYRGGPVLSGVGRFEAFGALLAGLLTSVFVIGFLARRRRTVWRIGYDSLFAMILFAGGLALLSTLA